MEVTIRKALLDDAPSIVRVHYDAVHFTAAPSYSAEILEEWSSSNPDRAKLLKQQMKENRDNTIMLVAVIGGEIIGFGEVSLATQELRAVYVSPSASRKGVGKRLLAELEDTASKCGVESLWLDSSLNAQKFYAANGYLTESRGEHRLNSGMKMPCVKMRKTLS